MKARTCSRMTWQISAWILVPMGADCLDHSILAELLVAFILGLRNAVRKDYQQISGANLDMALPVGRVRQHAQNGTALL